jgi:hypothetical protein
MMTGAIFKAGTVKRFLERNMGTARATYPGRRWRGNRCSPLRPLA